MNNTATDIPMLQKLSPQLRLLLEFIALTATGSLITLALTPFELWPLAMIAMVILHLSLNMASTRQALWRGLAFAFGLQLSGNFWIFVSIHDHGGANVFLAGIMTAGLALFLASWFMLLAYFYVRYIRDKKGGNTLGFTALWIFSEWLKTSLLTGFPWLFLGYSQLHAPLHNWAPVIGTFGISFILVYTSAVTAKTIKEQKLSLHWLAIITLWLMPLYLGTIQWTEKKSGEAISVGMLQPNIDLEEKWDPNFREPTMDYLKSVTADLKNIDLVIWPETAIPDLYNYITDYLNEIDTLAKRNNSTVILGVASKWYEGEYPIYHNSILAIGNGNGIYHKQKLVPFGEYMPMESMLRGLIEFFDLPMSSFRPGPAHQKPLKVKDILIMPYICYEVVYPEFVAQSAGAADILLTISNDAWFGTSIGPLQHMQMAQMRALETGRYIIRDTNNGVTAIINPNGDITASVPQFERTVLKANVYAYQGLTPVTRYGTLPPVILSMVILLLLWRLPLVNKETLAL